MVGNNKKNIKFVFNKKNIKFSRNYTQKREGNNKKLY
jgi:hypothetical protein